MENSEKKFTEGFIVKPPHEKAPEFVKAKVAINKGEFMNWLDKQEGDWVNLDVKVSKGGKWYAQVNEWKPRQDEPKAYYGNNEVDLSDVQL